MKTYSAENQTVNSRRAMYYQLCNEAGLCTPAERKLARKSSPVQERRSSKPRKGVMSTVEVAMHFSNTTFRAKNIIDPVHKSFVYTQENPKRRLVKPSKEVMAMYKQLLDLAGLK